MRASFDPLTREAALEADGPEFAQLADAARRDGEQLPCVPVRMADAGGLLPLPNVAVRPTADPGAPVSFRVEGPGLVVSGGATRLELLARDFGQLAHADPGGRLLVEWFPGHAYLAQGSVPLVLLRTADPADGPGATNG